jgi:hypothetical protein
MERVIQNSLTDVPAAAAAMSAIWLLVLAGARSKRRGYAAAGLAVGIAVSLRAFYLYPALLAAGAMVAMVLLRKLALRHAAPFWIALALPIAIQFATTHARTGSWSFIDERSTKMGEELHFETTTYGYDTLLRGGGGAFRYEASQCFQASRGMADAARKHEYGEIICLLARRQWFYFGSFVRGGQVYLSAARDRGFSALFLAVNAIALLAAVSWVVRWSKHPWLLAVPGTLLGAVWAEGSLIIPESRFMMAFNVVLWLLVLAGVHDLLLRADLRLRKRRDKREPSEVAVNSGAVEGRQPLPTSARNWA